MKKYARYMIIIGIALIIIGVIALEISPDRIYATLPYGGGIVRHYNIFGHTVGAIGVILAILGWISK